MKAEQLRVHKTIFQDYCNHRDRLKAMVDDCTFILNPAQEKRITQLARMTFRQREYPHTTRWFIDLYREVNQLFTTVKVKDWPSMRGR